MSSEEDLSTPRIATTDRRKQNIPVAIDRRKVAADGERRNKGERRRQVDPTTCEARLLGSGSRVHEGDGSV